MRQKAAKSSTSLHHSAPKISSSISMERALAYRNEAVVLRLCQNLELRRVEAELLFSDLLRFLYLCATSKKSLAPSRRIDSAWHEFLLFTRDYQCYCKRHLGTVVHHVPIGSNPGVKVVQSARCESSCRDKALRGKSASGLTALKAKACFGALSDNWN